MNKIWSFFLLSLLLISCNTKNKHINTTDYIPENASVIIQVNNLESLKSNFNNNDFLEGLNTSKSYTDLTKKIQNLKYLNTVNPLLICFNYDEKDSLQYTVITKQTPDLFAIDSLPNISIEAYLFENLSIHKTQIDKSVTYNTVIDSVFVASSSKDILEASLITTNKDDELKTILKIGDTKKPFSILVNNSHKPPIQSVFINDKILFKNFTNYTLVDADINQDAIILNGITKATDSTKHLINIFKNTIAKENKTANLTPSNADGFMSFTFNDFSILNKNLKQYNKVDTLATETSLFDNIIEVGVIYEGKNQAVFLNSLDVIATKDALLNDQNLVETFRQTNIYDFSKTALFSNTFSPLITFKDANFYANINDYFLFTSTKEALENIIVNHQNKTTYNEKAYYKNTKEQLTNASSLLMVANPSALKNILENNLEKDLNLKLGDYKTSALQFVYDTNFAHVNAIIKKNKITVRENSVTELYNIKLDADLLNNPQLVDNHINKQKDIVVQDINNTLYLISNRGKVLWKKQLQGPILGKVQQIDMYKNGRLQLVFATPNRVYVLDRTGKNVAPFPLKFNDVITQPLSVFDYDNNKKYRLVVTQGKNILMYDAKGKTVKGFTFKSAESTINHQPQHFRIGRKDYLTFKTDNRLYILDRIGKTRVTPKSKYSFSNQALYLYYNKFTTTTKDGKLVSFNTNGTSNEQNLNLGSKHHLATTTKTLVAQSENKLTIKSKTLDLDFGNYDTPKLFYINDKIYVSATDLQTQKVYLYDSNGKLQNNFPVYGNSAIALDNLDKDRNLEFVTKGENDAILIYQIN
ncbi:ribonuclease HII [Oceanihabitans sp. 2_MG-2023]|uniref:ribonuclease HII n=1 Tax=Oceanihabitans sp. 2_MG-2023 TaxID=3062661 RepID=UPI0026E396D2|nr:ribonuclease HII [Oceanihabitans sp. 2_MG-2023]MDO6596054.1 ribonuclease HII [Oceanihabitans sp. 2_MG-2023]